jgi:hypothetical protein
MDYIVESGSSTVVATAQNKQAMVDNDNASEIAGSRGEEEEVVKLLSIEKLDWVMPEHLVMRNGRPPIWSSVSAISAVMMSSHIIFNILLTVSTRAR